MAFNIADIIEHAVELMPDRLALVCGDQRRTYAQLDGRANQAAHALTSLGVQPGDHVGIYAQNCAEWVETMLACFKLRAVPINVNYRYVAEELRYIFDNADLVGVVVEAVHRSQIEELAPDLPIAPFVLELGEPYEVALAAESAEHDFGPRSPDDLYLLYTGGTTGMPKGVMWRHEDIFMALGQGISSVTGHKVAHDRELAESGAARQPTVLLSTFPLMHGTAQWGVLSQLAMGNTAVLLPRFDGEATWTAVDDTGANAVVIAGDAMGRPMVEALEHQRDRWDLSTLVAVSSSGALFSAAVKERLFAQLPNLVISESVGSSEGGFTGMASFGRDDPTGGRGGGLARVSPMADVLVVDDDLRPLSPGDGRIGKFARGGNIPLGYYKDEAKTAATFLTDERGHRYVVNGDFARWEADGTVVLLGRGSAVINSGGEKIFPEEVEEALKAHPDVADVLIVGVPHERWGSAVAAVVQPQPGAAPDLESLNEVAGKVIARYKLPRHAVIVDAIERSPAGKPDHRWAEACATAAVAAQAP